MSAPKVCTQCLHAGSKSTPESTAHRPLESGQARPPRRRGSAGASDVVSIGELEESPITRWGERGRRGSTRQLPIVDTRGLCRRLHSLPESTGCAQVSTARLTARSTHCVPPATLTVVHAAVLDAPTAVTRRIWRSSSFEQCAASSAKDCAGAPTRRHSNECKCVSGISAGLSRVGEVAAVIGRSASGWVSVESMPVSMTRRA